MLCIMILTAGTRVIYMMKEGLVGLIWSNMTLREVHIWQTLLDVVRTTQTAYRITRRMFSLLNIMTQVLRD